MMAANCWIGLPMIAMQADDIFVALLVFIDYCNIHVATYISQLSYSCAYIMF